MSDKASPEEVAAALNGAQCVNMRQALAVCADIVASYIGSMRPVGIEQTDEAMKQYHQMAVAFLIFDIVVKSKHPIEMAGILEALASDLRERGQEQAAPRMETDVMVDSNANEPKSTDAQA